jgi:hypothetical protein
MAAARKGPVESATRAMAKTLGSLTARELVTAEAAYKLAAQLDVEGDGTKAAALSRELRIVVATLTPAAGAAAPRPQSTPAADPVQRAQDQLAVRRKARAAK